MTDNLDNPLGNIFISHRAIATIAAQTALSFVWSRRFHIQETSSGES